MKEKKEKGRKNERKEDIRKIVYRFIPNYYSDLLEFSSQNNNKCLNS